jgi:hypothetical protein
MTELKKIRIFAPIEVTQNDMGKALSELVSFYPKSPYHVGTILELVESTDIMSAFSPTQQYNMAHSRCICVSDMLEDDCLYVAYFDTNGMRTASNIPLKYLKPVE